MEIDMLKFNICIGPNQCPNRLVTLSLSFSPLSFHLLPFFLANGKVHPILFLLFLHFKCPLSPLPLAGLYVVILYEAIIIIILLILHVHLSLGDSSRVGAPCLSPMVMHGEAYLQAVGVTLAGCVPLDQPGVTVTGQVAADQLAFGQDSDEEGEGDGRHQYCYQVLPAFG